MNVINDLLGQRLKAKKVPCTLVSQMHFFCAYWGLDNINSVELNLKKISGHETKVRGTKKFTGRYELVLPKGVTGFINEVEENENFSSFKNFKKDCFGQSLEIGNMLESGVTPNFHQCEIKINYEHIAILCNAIYKVIAFVQRPVESRELVFIDCPELQVQFGNFQYSVLTALECNREVTVDDLLQLGKFEQREVRKWNPKRVGDLVFNYWD